MPRFVRLSVPAEAHYFDGSDGAARAIAAAFPYRAARSLDGREQLLVLCGSRLVRVLEESWVVEDEATRMIEIVPGDQFEMRYRPGSS